VRDLKEKKRGGQTSKRRRTPRGKRRGRPTGQTPRQGEGTRGGKLVKARGAFWILYTSSVKHKGGYLDLQNLSGEKSEKGGCHII